MSAAFFCQASILNVRDMCFGNDIDVGIKNGDLLSGFTVTKP
jgi:hypothetical protein